MAWKYSRAVRRSFCVYALQCLRSENRTELSSLLRRQIYPYVCSSLTPTYWHFLTFYAPCSKCILAYVPRVHMFAPTLLCSRFVLNEFLPKSSLPNILVSFLFIDENVNRFVIIFVIQKLFSFIIVSLSSVKKMSLTKIMTKIIRQRN